MMKVINTLVLVLVIIGALNWGLIAVFSFDLVAWAFGAMTMLTRIVYGLVAIAGLWAITFFTRISIDE